jgi:hypothetical protein
MSLYCAVGSVETELSLEQMKTLLSESLAKAGHAEQCAGRAS